METTTLDDFIKENNIDKIDYLKIDVEGAEYRVLEGLIKNLELKLSIFIWSMAMLQWLIENI